MAAAANLIAEALFSNPLKLNILHLINPKKLLRHP